ncbi:TPA: helix-turn-helix domain-containing protein [Photobacterium damselae]
MGIQIKEHLDCSNIDIWSSFLTRFNTKVINAEEPFHGSTRITSFTNGTSFISDNSTRLSIATVSPSSSFVVILTYGPCNWINGENSGSILSGLMILDSNKPMFLEYPSSKLCKIVTIPEQLVGNIASINWLKEHIYDHDSILYFDLITDIMKSISHDDLCLEQQIKIITNSISIPREHRTEELDTTYSMAINLIKKNLTVHSFNMSSLAKELHISKSSLQKMFFSHRTSYIGIVTTLRLELFKANLDNKGKQSIKTISYNSGYRSVSNASKQFKDTYGLSPQKYIERKKKQQQELETI